VKLKYKAVALQNIGLVLNKRQRFAFALWQIIHMGQRPKEMTQPSARMIDNVPLVERIRSKT
jgi:hypothetical protein